MLKRAGPMLEEAIRDVQALSKHDLTELKSMNNPPNTVKLVMQAVCILLEVPPVQHKILDDFGYYYSYWDAAVGREVLGHPHL